MKRLESLLRTLIALLCLAAAGHAAAADRFYFLGYGVIQVIDGERDEIVADIPAQGAMREAEVSADHKFLYVTASRHLVHKVDLAANRVVATTEISGDGWDRLMFGFALAPDGRTAYGSFMSRRTDGGEVVIGKPVVAQFDLATGKPLRSLEVPYGVVRLMSVEGGRIIYAFGQDLYKIDTTGSELRIVETVPMFDKGMNIFPLWTYDTGGVVSHNYYTEKNMGLLLVDSRSGAIEDVVIKGEPAMLYSVVVAPDRKKAYGVMDDLVVIDLAKKAWGVSVPLREGTCYGVNLSSDGRKVYAGGAGPTVTVFDAKTLKPLKVLKMASDGMDIRRISF